jgi:hypothetical protein
MTINAARRVRAPGIELSQVSGARAAKGTLRIEDPDARVTIRAEHFGVLQLASGWASVTGIATVSSGESEPFTLIVERDRPMAIYSSARRTVSSPLARVEIGGPR